MPRDTHTPTRLTAWTTYDELTQDQRERFGAYVLAKDEARRRSEANQAGEERAAAALQAAGGDKLKALGALLGGVA
jgi:hypothetical protein